MIQPKLIVHGLDLSYFTGKLEAYLRAKGLPYELREMSTKSFRACAKATGVLQMPQLECPDGSWLTDTSLIIRHFEETQPSVRITPTDPLARFVSHLIEDFGDESLWRPALYYRWAFADDARLMSGRIARGMMRDVPLPFAVRRQMILRRQQMVYLKQDGVTPKTRLAIEALYFSALSAMETALALNPFVLGARPTDADFGLFGSMFRHFFSDPTPAKIMRDVAPRTLSWVARLWNIHPSDFATAKEITTIPEGCVPLLRLIARTHLTYMAANARAVAANAKAVRFQDHGADFETPVSPYRAWCLAELQREFATLSSDEQKSVDACLGAPTASKLLRQTPQPQSYHVPQLPISSSHIAKIRDRNWV